MIMNNQELSTYLRIKRSANKSDIAGCFLICKANDFQESFIKYIIETAQNYVYIFSRNSEQINTENIEKFIVSRKSPINVQLLVIKEHVEHPARQVNQIGVYEITKSQIKQNNDSLNFIIADDRIMALELSTQENEWMSSFNSRKTVNVMKKFFIMHTRKL